MSEANRDEVEKCKQVDGLLHLAKAGGGSNSPSASTTVSGGGATSDGPRYRAGATGGSPASAQGAARSASTGKTYTPEQMQMVQRILRTKDYYGMLGVSKEDGEEAIKKAYKKLALKLHPDKCGAPGAEEAFKKVSRAMQCLTDADKRQIYDQYGYEDRVPRTHRHHFRENDFMTPEDLFAAFFTGGVHMHHQRTHPRGGQGGHRETSDDQVRNAQLFQMLPIILLVGISLLSQFSGSGSGGRFSFNQVNKFQFERTTDVLGATYYVAEDFERHYPEDSRELRDFERQVDVYHIHNLHSQCDFQEKMMYKKVMIAKRRGTQHDLEEAKKQPRPACKEMDRIKRSHQNLYRQALYGGF